MKNRDENEIYATAYIVLLILFTLFYIYCQYSNVKYVIYNSFRSDRDGAYFKLDTSIDPTTESIRPIIKYMELGFDKGHFMLSIPPPFIIRMNRYCILGVGATQEDIDEWRENEQKISKFGR